MLAPAVAFVLQAFKNADKVRELPWPLRENFRLPAFLFLPRNEDEIALVMGEEGFRFQWLPPPPLLLLMVIRCRRNFSEECALSD